MTVIKEGTLLSLDCGDGCLRATRVSPCACEAILLSALADLTREDSAGVKGGGPADGGQEAESRRADE